MKQASDFTAAVIGTGFIGPVHVEALRRLGIPVAAIIGSSPEKSAAAASRLGISQLHQTFEDVLADPEIDVIHLATPNHLHDAGVRAVLSAGKHVLCEKPLAMTSGQTSELCQLAARGGLAAGVAYNIRSYPLCHEARDRIGDSKAFGEISHISGHYSQDWLLWPTDFNWRVTKEKGGELRAIADIGTHLLDLIQWICHCKVVSLCADLQTVHPRRFPTKGTNETFTGSADDKTEEGDGVEIDTEDAGNVLLRFDNGAHGSIRVSQTTAGRKNHLQFEIAGRKQTLAFASERPNEMWIGYRDRPNEVVIRDPALLGTASASIADYPGGHAEGFPDTFKQLFRKFYSYIAQCDFAAVPEFPTFEDGHREVLLCEKIMESHLKRGWVDV